MTQNEHVYAICHRPEAAGDDISGFNVKTTDGYGLSHFDAAIAGGFRENQNQPFA